MNRLHQAAFAITYFLLGGLVLGADVRCTEADAQRLSLASLQLQVDELYGRVSALELAADQTWQLVPIAEAQFRIGVSVEPGCTSDIASFSLLPGESWYGDLGCSTVYAMSAQFDGFEVMASTGGARADIWITLNGLGPIGSERPAAVPVVLESNSYFELESQDFVGEIGGGYPVPGNPSRDQPRLTYMVLGGETIETMVLTYGYGFVDDSITLRALTSGEGPGVDL